MSSKTHRFSEQNQQGQRGQLQVSDRFVSFGWPTSVPTPDLGEDLIVHVWNRGRATGITFHTQVKSVSDRRVRIRGKHISYPFETKDLTHWERFGLPVVLVIWDVVEREGCWILVEEALAQLDKRRPGWRTGSKKPTVHIPVANMLDDSGLEKLRIEIGTRVMPLIMKDRTLHINLTGKFPNTPDGREALGQMKRAFETGESAELSGEYIQDVKFDDWWAEWFQPSGFKPDRIEIGPAANPNPIHVSIGFIGHNGDAVQFESIAFYRKKVGTSQATLEGESLRGLVKMTLELNFAAQPRRLQFTWTTRAGVGSVTDAKKLVDLSAILEQGGLFVLSFDADQRSGKPQPFSPHRTGIDPELRELIRKLYVIQNRTGHLLTIPDPGISVEDVNLVNAVYQIITTGILKAESVSIYKFELHASGTVDLLSQFSPDDTEVELRLEYLDAIFEIFGENISFGPLERSISGKLDRPVADYLQLATQLPEDEQVALIVHSATIVEVFKNWLPTAGI